MKTQKTIVKTLSILFAVCILAHPYELMANETIEVDALRNQLNQAIKPLKKHLLALQRPSLEINQSLIIPVELKVGEINNQELVAHFGYFENIQSLNFKESSLALAPKEKLDEVRHVQASYKKSGTTEAIDNGDDLVIFDYSASGSKSSNPLMGKGSMSDTVKNAISRELTKNKSLVSIHGIKEAKKSVNNNVLVGQASSNKIQSNDEKLKELIGDNDDVIIYEYTKNVKKSNDKNSILKALEEARLSAVAQAEVIVNALEIKLGSQKSLSLQGFEFVPDFERAQRISDGNTGDLKISYPISDDNASIITGVIQAQGLIPTRVELNLANQKQVIPLLNEGDIQKFLEKKQMHVIGNIIMAELSDNIRDVEIDSNYQAKIFLDKKFSIQEDVNKAQYVMFLGTQVGNTLIKYLLENSQTASKIIYVGDGEMYFDSSDFESSKREMYSFMTRSLLGKSVKELSINEDLISVLGTSAKSKKRTINTYELKLPEMIRGERNYLEFKHHGYSLFVGTKGFNEIEVPGNDFIAKVMEINGLANIGERCMVQVNLSKELRHFEVSGKNKQGEMFVETTYLDQDGNFSVDSSEWAEKVFISGDMEGMFNAKIEYADGSVHFLKTFCSQGSYIVEQL